MKILVVLPQSPINVEHANEMVDKAMSIIGNGCWDTHFPNNQEFWFSSIYAGLFHTADPDSMICYGKIFFRTSTSCKNAWWKKILQEDLCEDDWPYLLCTLVDYKI